MTAKHKMETLETKKTPKNAKPFLCSCGKIYKNRTGLWKHRQKCTKIDEFEKNEKNEKNEEKVEDEKELKGMIHQLIKQNTELQTMLIDQQKEHINHIQEIIPKIGNTTNNMTNNFNLNIFLNETCKDAMNLMDFVKSLQICSADLENTGRLGYSEGMSKIIIDGLKELDLHQRPVHCSDVKKEVLYVKDNDTWEKDDNREIMKKAITHIDKESTKQLHTWLEENPKCMEEKSDDYTNIVTKVINNSEKECDDVIKKIAKEVVIK
tara:strand:+ start:5240 stop:6034 length:795 start_codon:yes stop_codon:yes gene_type:complete